MSDNEKDKTSQSSSVIFTIVSANYIGFAATLMQSVREFHPDSSRFIILADAYREFDDIDLAADVIVCDELDIPLLANMKLWYSVVEFNTAVKPYTFQHMLKVLGFQLAIYLDPDIRLFSPLEEVFSALVDNDIVLTPHMMVPLQDGKEPSDLSIMKAGVYNLGFLGVRNCQNGRFLMQWWSERLFAHCRIDVAGNMFTDQRWMDLAPVLVEKPFILRHPGYNVAYWNISGRTVDRLDDGSWVVNGRSLRFFHFSGIKPDDDLQFSKYQNRFDYKNLGVITQLCSDYRYAVKANRWKQFSLIDYAYGKFPDSRPITDGMRRSVLRAIDDGRLNADAPLTIGSTYFDQPDDEVFAGNRKLTRLAYQFWLDRPDLQRAFDLQALAGFEGFVSWFCEGAAEGEGVHPSNITAAMKLRDGIGTGRRPVGTSIVASRPPPWPSVASCAWTGLSTDVSAWLQEDVRFQLGRFEAILPKQIALLWERRPDLQSHFPLGDGMRQVESYVAWGLTGGFASSSLLFDLFSSDFIGTLTELSSMSGYYNDVPITSALILTASSEQSRRGFPTWRRFPIDKSARVEHGLWFSYVAPSLFSWPVSLYASVKGYFDSPTSVTVEGYSFTIGMLALWEIRGDLQRIFRLDSPISRWQFLGWLLFHAPRDFNVDVLSFCPGIRTFLAAPSTLCPAISRILYLVYDEREDLRAVFPLNTPEGVADLLNWSHFHMTDYLREKGLDCLLEDLESDMNVAQSPVQAHVALTGHWEATSGLGEDLRSSVDALDSCGYDDYVIVDFDSSRILTASKNALPGGTKVAVQLNIVHRNAETSAEDWRTVKDMGVITSKSIGHWHWELDRLPSYWRHTYSFYDEIWASSKFAMDAFSADAIRPVRLLHGAVTPPKRSQSVSRRQLGLLPSATVFLFMFDFASYAVRKNPQAVIRAFILAFPCGDENVQLMIKTQNATKMPDMWEELVNLSTDKRIIMRDVKLTRDELVSLMITANAFVSLHRSEGYGRGPAEAMLLGCPVIMTAYSGTNDFADNDCACLVDFKMVPVHPDEYPGVEGQSWAEADSEDAAYYMRWVHAEPAAAQALGQKGKRKIAGMLSPSNVGVKMIDMIAKAGVQ